MNISEKQKLYLDILEMVLPYLRNVETHGFWRRIRYGRFYAETELVHNLPRILVSPEVEIYDVHWLNTQARMYVSKGRRDFPFYIAICERLKKLFAMVPVELRGELLWKGP
jgi:hypothetical protein